MNYEKNTFYIGLISLSIGLFSLIYAKQAIEVSRDIAEQSGSLDRSELNISIGSFDIPKSGELRILMGSPSSLKENSPSIGIIPFTIESKGKKSLDNISITLQYDNFFKRDLLQDVDISRTDNIGSISLNRSILKNENRTFMSHTVNSLNPGIAVNISEPIFMHKTTIKDKVTATTLDGVQITIPFEARTSLQFAAIFSARDTPIRTHPISISFFQSNSLRDLIEKNLIDHINDQQKILRNKLSSAQYFAALLSPQKESVYLIFSPTKDITVTEGAVAVPNGSPNVAKIDYPTASWNLLFSTK